MNTPGPQPASVLADDLIKLREEYPAWRFGTVWASAASDPNARRIWATRDGILLTAWTGSELRLKIAAEASP